MTPTAVSHEDVPGTVAIVHDYLTQRGGAERVVLAMASAFPGAPIYTSLYEPGETFPEFADLDVRPLWTNRIAALRRDHRRGLPLYPLAFSGLKIDADMVICSSSGFAHGVRTSGCKIVYCYTPARWLYDQAGTYLAGWSPMVRLAARAVGGPLRAWDGNAIRSADVVLTSSTAVRDRIAAAYGIDAEVVPPPAPAPARSAGLASAVPGVEPGFVLCVSRLLAYKNVDAVVQAFALLPDVRLVVVGEGPERQFLDALAGPNVSFLGRVNDAELAWLYANCVGIVSASREDFGLTPIEAAASGKPAAVLRYGGFLDTVLEGKTGVFFNEPVPAEIAGALRELLKGSWDVVSIAQRAEEFSEASFARHLHAAAGPMSVGITHAQR